ncbi:SNF2-related domain-containing protein [Reticulomyxa filosa]|uniref:SNF2-related domain-containing protein n=1 Tax=Reticulomyxa filosa TaxID=46433 RepID=X6L7C6_RETFI|nr:SNF2-related domain-containing protein [Reticulomyxa filosa]|eukprot:ETN97672.1 SNF2-related domain-containing protein [Reticulomyxa filosa]
MIEINTYNFIGLFAFCIFVAFVAALIETLQKGNKPAIQNANVHQAVKSATTANEDKNQFPREGSLSNGNKPHIEDEAFQQVKHETFQLNKSIVKAVFDSPEHENGHIPIYNYSNNNNNNNNNDNNNNNENNNTIRHDHHSYGHSRHGINPNESDPTRHDSDDREKKTHPVFRTSRQLTMSSWEKKRQEIFDELYTQFTANVQTSVATVMNQSAAAAAAITMSSALTPTSTMLLSSSANNSNNNNDNDEEQRESQLQRQKQQQQELQIREQLRIKDEQIQLQLQQQQQRFEEQQKKEREAMERKQREIEQEKERERERLRQKNKNKRKWSDKKKWSDKRK